uniref:Uncharacterized protein n=1 Tax=Cannabis sativa TaxID=3483 RepID=A0A803P5Y5_CANSA
MVNQQQRKWRGWSGTKTTHGQVDNGSVDWGEKEREQEGVEAGTGDDWALALAPNPKEHFEVVFMTTIEPFFKPFAAHLIWCDT